MQRDGSAAGEPNADPKSAFQMRLQLLRQAPNCTQLPSNRRLQRRRKLWGWSHQLLAGRMVLVEDNSSALSRLCLTRDG